MNKREIVKHLAVCKESHGTPWNAATVYGHVDKTCIRLAGTRVWVYSPGASAFDLDEEQS